MSTCRIKLSVYVTKRSSWTVICYIFLTFFLFKFFSFDMVFISQVQITCFYSVMVAVTTKAQRTLNFKDNKVERKS